MHTIKLYGVEVVPGQVRVSAFLREAIEKAGGNRKYSGSLEDLEKLTETHIRNATPGVGAKNGDVLVVKLPIDGFFTDIVQIDETNSEQLEVTFNARREGEEPVPTLLLRGAEPQPAASASVVIYRADVLEQDNDRSSLAQWEIVAILTDPLLPEGKTVPMHPATMARNAAHLVGGTLRSYSVDEWLEATLFWQRHARAVPLLPLEED